MKSIVTKTPGFSKFWLDLKFRFFCEGVEKQYECHKTDINKVLCNKKRIINTVHKNTIKRKPKHK